MDYYQGIVADFLTGDPTVFVKPEFCVRLDADGPLKKGEHWYCDILAVSFGAREVYLCEVTYSQTVGALYRRLRDWAENWGAIREAIHRDAGVPRDWEIRPWVFVPREQGELAKDRITRIRAGFGAPGDMPEAEVTCLEDVVPWLHRSPHGRTKRTPSTLPGGQGALEEA